MWIYKHIVPKTFTCQMLMDTNECCSLIKILFLGIIYSIFLQRVHVSDILDGSHLKPCLMMGVARAEFQSLEMELRSYDC